MAYLGRNSLPFASTWAHSRFFGGVRVTHLYVFCIVFFLGLLYLSCIPNVVSVSGLSIHDWLFGFL